MKRDKPRNHDASVDSASSGNLGSVISIPRPIENYRFQSWSANSLAFPGRFCFGQIASPALSLGANPDQLAPRLASAPIPTLAPNPSVCSYWKVDAPEKRATNSRIPFHAYLPGKLHRLAIVSNYDLRFRLCARANHSFSPFVYHSSDVPGICFGYAPCKNSGEYSS